MSITRSTYQPVRRGKDQGKLESSFQDLTWKGQLISMHMHTFVARMWPQAHPDRWEGICCHILYVSYTPVVCVMGRCPRKANSLLPQHQKSFPVLKLKIIVVIHASSISSNLEICEKPSNGVSLLSAPMIKGGSNRGWKAQQSPCQTQGNTKMECIIFPVEEKKDQDHVPLKGENKPETYFLHQSRIKYLLLNENY